MRPEPLQIDRTYVWAGSLLRDWRERAGLTHEALAQMAGVSENSVRNYEAGQSPSAALAARFAAILTAVLRKAKPDEPLELTPLSFYVLHDRTLSAD